MGVRINVSKTFRTLVKFTALNEDGKKEEQSYYAVFKRLTSAEVKEMVESNKGDVELCRDVLVGWTMEDLVTKEKTEFTPENLELFLSIPGAAGVTMLRFMETVGASREKN